MLVGFLSVLNLHLFSLVLSFDNLSFFQHRRAPPFTVPYPHSFSPLFRVSVIITMAQPPSSSQPKPFAPPAYAPVDVEGQHQTPMSFEPYRTRKQPPGDTRGWIHALFGLQGARDPSYDEKDFLDKLTAIILMFIGFVRFIVLALLISPGWLLCFVGAGAGSTIIIRAMLCCERSD